MHDRMERAASMALTCAALVMAGTLVHREFAAPAPAQQGSTSALQAPTRQDVWSAARGAGAVIGDTSAPVRVVVFSDLECPFCRNFHVMLRSHMDDRPNTIALLFVHFPIPSHRFAVTAARISECAGEQGRFAAVIDRLFAEQDSLGVAPWGSIAARAGVPDTLKLMRCAKSVHTFPNIDRGTTLGQSLNVAGTPTVFVNGWRFQRPPTRDQIDSVIAAVAR